MSKTYRYVISAGAALLSISVVANLILGYRLAQAPAQAKPAPAKPTAPPVAAEENRAFIRTQFFSEDEELFLQFGEAIDREEVRTHLAITPEVEVSIRQTGDSRLSICAQWQPETYYRLIFKKGLQYGEKTLAEDYAIGIVTPKSSPLLDFASAGKVLPRFRANHTLPLQLRNIDKVTATVSRIYPENLGSMEFDTGMAKKITEKTFELSHRDGKYYWPLPWDELMPDSPYGIYLLRVNHENSWRQATQIVTVTDLALHAVLADDALMTVVRRLSDSEAVAEAEVKLFSAKNQLLAQGFTDAQGVASLQYSLLADPTDRPELLTVESDGDRSYLKLYESASALNTSEFNSAGTKLPAEAQDLVGLLYPERELLHPGETVSIFAEVRERDSLELPDSQPLELVVSDHNGSVIERIQAESGRFGFAGFRVRFPDNTASANYTAKLIQPGQEDSPLATTTLTAGHFMPTTFTVTSALSANPDATTTVKAEAQYYYHAPVANQKFRVYPAILLSRFKAAKFPDFTFGVLPNNPKPRIAAQEIQGFTAADGSLLATIPQLYMPEALPNCQVNLSVLTSVTSPDKSVDSIQKLVSHLNPWYLGLKHLATDRDKQLDSFAWAAVAPDESPFPMSAAEFTYSLKRREWSYTLRENADSVRREWISVDVPVAEGKLTDLSGKSAGHFQLPAHLPGYYLLSVVDPQSQIAAELEYTSGYGDDMIRPGNPALLKFTTDKARYRPGETAHVRFDLPAKATVIVTAGQQRVESAEVYQATPGGNLVPVTIPAELRSGNWDVAVTAVIYDATGKGTPQRSFGVTRLAVDQEEAKIHIAATTPEVCRPGMEDKITFKLTDSAGKPMTGMVQVWGVETGWLALSDWRQPDSFKHFFGEYENTMRFFDLYGTVYPELTITADGKIGGDKLFRRWAMESLGTPRQYLYRAPAAITPATVETESDGTVTVPMRWPENFNGQLTLMAHAIGAKGVGSLTREVIVRDPVTVEAACADTVAPGDRFEVLFSVHNVEAADAEITLNFTTENLHLNDSSPATLRLKAGERVEVRLEATPGENFQPAAVVATYTLDGAPRQAKAVTRVVQPGVPKTEISARTLAPGESATFRPEIGKFLPGSVSSHLQAGSPRSTQILQHLSDLNNDGTTLIDRINAALPHLESANLVRAGLLPTTFAAESRNRVERAIGHLRELNRYGSYSAWIDGGGDSETASTIAAAHFLFEAAARGFQLEPRWRAELLQELNNLLDSPNRATLEERSRICYVLALAGAPAKGDAERCQAEAPANSLTQLWAVAAQLKSNRGTQNIEPFRNIIAAENWRNASVEALAFTLYLASEALPGEAHTQAMGEALARQLDRDPGAIQGWPWLALAQAAALLGDSNAAATTATIQVGDAPVQTLGEGENAALPLPPDSAVEVRNTGNGPLGVRTTLIGVPEKLEAVSRALSVKRRYLNTAGEAVTQAQVGDLLTVELTLASPGALPAVWVEDQLPGALEVEDERIQSRSAFYASGSHVAAETPRRLERLDDRARLLVALDGPTERTFQYQVRVVSAGDFALMPVSATSLDNPEVQALLPGDGRFKSAGE